MFNRLPVSVKHGLIRLTAAVLLCGVLFALAYDRTDEPEAPRDMETAYHRISIERTRLEFLDAGWAARFSAAAEAVGSSAAQVRQDFIKWRPFFDFIDRENRRVLLTTPQGHLFSYDLEAKSARPVTSNLTGIIRDTAWREPSPEWLDGEPPAQKIAWLVELGARDIEILHDTAIGSVVLVAANRFEGACMRQVIYRAPLPEGDVTELTFDLLYTSSDCLVRHPDNIIARLVQRDARTVVAAIGQGADPTGTMDPKDVFGKSVMVDLLSGIGTRLTHGHRNPQGLTVLEDGTILMAEHGPRGGDEINILATGKGYGWPQVSYGIGYEPSPGQFARSQRPFGEPLFYFSPSIAISEIVSYRKPHFVRWQGNILATSLKDKAIHRLDFDIDDRVVRSSERIEVGCRIRDVELDTEGVIYAVCDNLDFLTIRRAAADYF